MNSLTRRLLIVFFLITRISVMVLGAVLTIWFEWTLLCLYLIRIVELLALTLSKLVFLIIRMLHVPFYNTKIFRWTALL